VGNSGNFAEARSLIWAGTQKSPFTAFMTWSDWLHGKVGRTDSIALVRLMALLFEFLTMANHLDSKAVAAALLRDYRRGGRRDLPEFLQGYVDTNIEIMPQSERSLLPKRQARHAGQRA